jgi:hypothetical protein
MKKIIFSLLLLAAALVQGCVDDKGNYAYTDVNEPVIDLPAVYRRVYLEDQTLRVEPRLSQTFAADNSNLSFAWRHSQLSVADARRQDSVASTDRWIDLTIKADDKRFVHYFWLEVTDALTGLVYPYHTQVQVVKPFANTWAVLHSGTDGKALLGAVEYTLTGDQIEHTDVFAEFGHAPLTGEPVALGENNNERANLPGESSSTTYNDLYLITTNPAESGVYLPWMKFQPYLQGVFIPQMVENYAASGFDTAGVTMIHKPNGDGVAAVANGTLFQGGLGLKLYKAKINPLVTGPVNISHALRMGGLALMYDDAGRRFLFYSLRPNAAINPTVGNFLASENSSTIQAMSDSPHPLSAIPHNVLHIGIGYKTSTAYQTIESFAIANGTDNRTYIYMFPSGNQISTSSNLKDLKSIATPAGLNADSRFASGTLYNNMVFYSAGSSVYMLDFSTGVSTLVYEHGTGGQIVALQMAKQEMPSSESFDYEAYGHNPGRSLGVAINRGASGELVVIDLNENGTMLDSKTYDGFGNIKDVKFVADIIKRS